MNFYRSVRLFDLNVVELRLEIQRKRIAYTWHLSYEELLVPMNTTSGRNNWRRRQSEHGCPLNPPSCLPNTVIRPFIPSHTHTQLSSKYWFIDFPYQIPVCYRWWNDLCLNSNVINVDIKKQFPRKSTSNAKKRNQRQYCNHSYGSKRFVNYRN